MACEHKDASRTAYPLPGGRYLTICEDCSAWYTSHESGWQPPRNPPRRTRLAELVRKAKRYRYGDGSIQAMNHAIDDLNHDDCPPFEGDPAESAFIKPDVHSGQDAHGRIPVGGLCACCQLRTTYQFIGNEYICRECTPTTEPPEDGPAECYEGAYHQTARELGELKARVDVIAEVMPGTPLPGEEGSRITLPGLVSRMTRQHLRILQQQQRIETLEAAFHKLNEDEGEPIEPGFIGAMVAKTSDEVAAIKTRVDERFKQLYSSGGAIAFAQKGRGELKVRFEKLEQRCHDNEDATGELREWVHHTVDPGIEKLTTDFAKLYGEFAHIERGFTSVCQWDEKHDARHRELESMLADTTPEVEAFVKAGIAMRGVMQRDACCLETSKTFCDTADALTAKRAEKGT